MRACFYFFLRNAPVRNIVLVKEMNFEFFILYIYVFIKNRKEKNMKALQKIKKRTSTKDMYSVRSYGRNLVNTINNVVQKI